MATNNRNGLCRLYRKSKTKCCYYCGLRLQIGKKGLDGWEQPVNAATMEHLYSRLDIRRLLSNKAVLSCAKCNHAKSVRDYNLVHFNGTYWDATSENAKGLLIKLLNGEINRFVI